MNDTAIPADTAQALRARTIELLGTDQPDMRDVSEIPTGELVEHQIYSPDGGEHWYVCYLPLSGCVSTQQAGTHDVVRVDAGDTVLAMTTIIDMDKVVEIVRAAGHYAFVTVTGGNVATIYAGVEREDLDDLGLPRWTAVAGSGSFKGPHWTLPRGDAAEFYVGADDGGDSIPSDAYTTAHAARLILEMLGEPGRELTAHEVERLDPTGRSTIALPYRVTGLSTEQRKALGLAGPTIADRIKANYAPLTALLPDRTWRLDMTRHGASLAIVARPDLSIYAPADNVSGTGEWVLVENVPGGDPRHTFLDTSAEVVAYLERRAA